MALDIGASISRELGSAGKDDSHLGSDATHRQAEADFNSEQQTLNDQFNADRDKPNDPTKLSSYHLFRASRQTPETVFRPEGELQSSTEFKRGLGGLPEGMPPTFNLQAHQTGRPSHYSSTTTSAESAAEFADDFSRKDVYVTDPQPHGRYLNGLGFKDPIPEVEKGLPGKMAAGMKKGIAKLSKKTVPATPYSVPEGLRRQNEVSVPGSIPTESVRGVLQYDGANQRLDYENYSRNPEYKSLQQYKK